SVDLLSKLMQGPDMKYRCSAAFQVRPVLIAPAEPPSYSELVGIDYNDGGVVIGEKGVHIDVIPSLGASLTSVSPPKFEVGAVLRIEGTDLNLEGISVLMGGVPLPMTRKTATLIECTVPASIGAGNLLSAGSHPIIAAQLLGSGHTLSSNAVTGGLLPEL